MAEEKEEEIKIVEPGRENDKLTKMAEGVYKTVNEYHDKNELHCLVLMADKTGGASFIIGDEKDDSQRVQGAHRISRSIQKSFKLDKEVTTWKKK